MRNGHSKSNGDSNSDELPELIRATNSLLIEQIGHLAAIESALHSILLYLPACASERKVDRKTVQNLAEFADTNAKKMMKAVNKRLKKLGF